MWTKWIPLVVVIGSILIARNWKNIRKASKEEKVEGMIAGVITFVVMTAAFALVYWAVHTVPVLVYGPLSVFLTYRFIKVRKEKKKSSYKKDPW